jgi:hypothetical protein
MITNTADLEMLSGEGGMGDLGELGWGWKSITGAVKKVAKATVIAPTKAAVKSTKWVTKKTLVDPTKIVAKSAYRAGAGTVTAGGKLIKGDVTGAGKAFVKAGLEPVRGGAELTKHAAKSTYEASKYLTNLALSPIRSRLTTLKNRRAEVLSWTKRGSKTPTTAEKAQARKDVKSMLSSKGPHGKMLAWLAGGPVLAGQLGELGVVGYDDAALAAIAAALTTSLVKIASDAAKSKFAPADAAKAGLKAGGTSALTTATEAVAPTVAKATAAKQTYEEFVKAAQADAVSSGWAPPVTDEEVAAEPEAEAEEAATEAETEAMEGYLRGLGMYDGFREATPAAAAPVAMDLPTARKIAAASYRLVCAAPTAALRAIGGPQGAAVVGSFCRSLETGDDAGVRATLPAVVTIASQHAADIATQVTTRLQSTEGFGCPSCGLAGYDGRDLGMLAAFAGADYDELSYGLSEVDAEGIRAADDAKTMPMLAFLPVAAAVLAGLWMATH